MFANQSPLLSGWHLNAEKIEEEMNDVWTKKFIPTFAPGKEVEHCPFAVIRPHLTIDDVGIRSPLGNERISGIWKCVV